MQVLSKFKFLVQSDTYFCDGVTVTVPFLACSLAVCAAILNTCWALVILAGFFLSVCLVAVFLFVCRDIVMVVVVDKKEREDRRLPMMSLV